MSDDVTYYELLNVAPAATADEIRSAYRQAMRTVHPDVGGNNALFRLVTTAYETLSDPAARARYDRQLAGPVVDERPGPSASPPRGGFTDEDLFGDDEHEQDWGWGHEWVYDPDAPRTQSRWERWVNGRGGFVAIVVSTSIVVVLFGLLAAMLIARPDLLRPEDARPDVLADLVSVWWATLIAAAVYALWVVGSIAEGAPIEFLALPDVATLFGFLWWVGAYWDIATEAEETRFLWIVATWVVYRVSVFTSTVLLLERH